MVLPNEGGPLGIHVVPDYSSTGNSGEPSGLLVQGVEPGGRISRDGRVQVRDRIVEINGHPLKDVPFHRAQELFRNALQVSAGQRRFERPTTDDPPIPCLYDESVHESVHVPSSPAVQGLSALQIRSGSRGASRRAESSHSRTRSKCAVNR